MKQTTKVSTASSREGTIDSSNLEEHRWTLAALGIPWWSYCRWLRGEAWARDLPAEPVQP